MRCYFLVSKHYFGVSVFYGGEEFVFNIHVLSQFGVGGGCEQTMQNVHHLCVAVIFVFVYQKHLVVVFVFHALVKETQHFVKSVVYVASQSRNLHYYAVVG